MRDKSRYKDLAILLPWLGLFLFTPPVLFLFQPDVSIGGIPLLPLYLFIIWFVLILASRQLTRHLVEENEPLAGRDDRPPFKQGTASSDERP